MTAKTKLAAIGGVVPIRISPTLGSDRNWTSFDALPQFIECGLATGEHGLSVVREFDAAGISLQKTHTERVFQIAD